MIWLGIMNTLDEFIEFSKETTNEYLFKSTKTVSIILKDQSVIKELINRKNSIKSIYVFYKQKKNLIITYSNFVKLVHKYVLDDVQDSEKKISISENSKKANVSESKIEKQQKNNNETNTTEPSNIKNKNVDNKVDKYQPSNNDFKNWNSTSHDIEKNFW